MADESELEKERGTRRTEAGRCPASAKLPGLGTARQWERALVTRDIERHPSPARGCSAMVGRPEGPELGYFFSADT